MESQNRIDEIDIVKGVGILCVVLGHCTGGWINYFVNGFHMPLFFIWGGVVTKVSPSEKGMKIFARESRLMYYYNIFSIAYIILDLITKVYIFQETSVQVLMKEDLIYWVTLRGIGVLWFLPALYIGKTYTRFIVTYINSKFVRIIWGFLSFFLILSFHSVLYVWAYEMKTAPCCAFLSAMAHGVMMGGLTLLGFEFKVYIMRLLNILKNMRYSELC